MSDEEIVGVVPGASAEVVERAFRKRALLLHPDRGGDPEAFRQLVSARDRLLATAPKEPTTCPDCEGEGKVTVLNGFSSIKMPCGVCGGSGVL